MPLPLSSRDGADAPLASSDVRNVRLTRHDGQSTLEVELAAEPPLTPDQQAELSDHLSSALPQIDLGAGVRWVVGQDEDVLHSQHVARLGAQLFSRHLVAVEVAGSVLLVALVGAIAIVLETRARSQRVDNSPSGGPRDA